MSGTKSTEKENNEILVGVEKIETGITGFDELLMGGLPEGRATLISAGTGCGKTVLLSEFLYQGIKKYDHPGIFVTFEERPRDILNNLHNFGWNLDKLYSSEKLAFVDGSPPEIEEVKIGSSEWLEPVLSQVKFLAEKIGAKRMAIDNLGTVFTRYGDAESNKYLRQQLFYFSSAIKKMGITTLISTERTENKSVLSQYGIEAFVSDGLIELDTHAGENNEMRTIIIKKLRGVGYRSGRVIFQINEKGIEIFPKIPINPKVAATEFTDRVSFGIPALDKAMGGGVPKGHIMLIAGNTGTGKTTLGLQFILAGLKNGENCVWTALEESEKQVVKTAEAHNWHLDGYADKGNLSFVNTSLIDIIPDKLLYQIINTVSENNAKRLIVDSISSLESATMSKEKVREFMIQLSGYAKMKGITVVMTYLTGDAFGAAKDQLLGSLTTNAMRLSSIVDGIVLLRYVERDQSVCKLLNILKLRGSHHVKDILRFEINEDGFLLGTRFGIDN